MKTKSDVDKLIAQGRQWAKDAPRKSAEAITILTNALDAQARDLALEKQCLADCHEMKHAYKETCEQLEEKVDAQAREIAHWKTRNGELHARLMKTGNDADRAEADLAAARAELAALQKHLDEREAYWNP